MTNHECYVTCILIMELGRTNEGNNRYTRKAISLILVCIEYTLCMPIQPSELRVHDMV